jgi:hypothetical protein
MNISYRSKEITKFYRTTLFFLIFFTLVPLSSCQSQENNKLDVSKNPSTSSNNQNTARNQTSITQKIVGKWRQYYSYSNGASPIISEYDFSLDGTFVDRTSYHMGEKSSLSGRYQVNANTLKMIYTNRTPRNSGTKEYSYPFTFEEVRFASDGDGEATRYLFLTEPGNTTPSRYQKVKPK